MKKIKVTGIILLTAFITLGSCSEEDLPDPPENPEAQCVAPIDAIAQFLQLDTVDQEMSVDVYLKIRDIPGESTDNGHDDEIEITSIEWNTGVRVAGKTNGGRQTVGRKMQSFVFVKMKDKATPKLKEAFASHKLLPEVILSIGKTTGRQQEYIEVELRNVSISSYSISAQGEAMETISLNFEEIK